MSDVRNIEDLKLEEIDEDFLRDQCIEMGMDLEVDTRQGSIYRDAAEGHIIRSAKFFDDLRQVAEIISLSTCTGVVLDEKLHERGLERNPPQDTPAHYYCLFNGATPEVGDLLTCEELEFVVESVGDRVIIVSVDTGTGMNSLPQGAAVIPEIDVDGLISCTLQEIAIPALDAESDDSARQRLINRVSGPDENGNASQIRSWCESVEGVGSARIIPRWDGPTTVKAVIISTSGTAPSAALVENVQDYIDPDASGMGEGKAAIGQFVTVVAVEELDIDISVDIVKRAEATYSGIADELKEAMTAYLKGLALERDADDSTVYFAKVSAIITELDDVIDHSNLKVNGGTANITFTATKIPVLGEVTINGNIL